MINKATLAKLAAWFLTAALVLTIVPVSSFAENADAPEVAGSTQQDALTDQVKDPDTVTEEDVITKDTDRTVYDLGGGQQMAVFYDCDIRTFRRS